MIKIKARQAQALSIIINLVLAIIAFAIILNSSLGIASGAKEGDIIQYNNKFYLVKGQVVESGFQKTQLQELDSSGTPKEGAGTYAYLDPAYITNQQAVSPNFDNEDSPKAGFVDAPENTISDPAAQSSEAANQAAAAAAVKDDYGNMANAAKLQQAGNTNTNTGTGIAGLTLLSTVSKTGETTPKIINGKYLVTSGEIANGKEVTVKDILTGDTQKIKIDDVSKLDITTAKAAQAQFSNAITYKNLDGASVTTSQLQALSTEEGVKAIAKDPEALKTLGAKSVEWKDGKAVIDKGEGATTTIDTAKGTVTSTAAGSSALSKFLKLGGGTTGDALATGLQWAFIVWGVAKMLGSFLGFNEAQTNALSLAAMSGTFVYQTFSTAGPQSFLNTAFQWGGFGPAAYPFLWGLGVAAIVFLCLYKQESQKIVSFQCQPWEAPTGGANCGKCNDELYACSEYRCKSLGQACQLLNAGTGKEKCAWVNPGDVKSPLIKPWISELTKDHEYKPSTAVRPPDTGVKITYKLASDGCIKAFTPLTFGILTQNEDGSCKPSQCKVDYNRTTKYDDMQYYFGGSNLYECNHSQTMALPSPDSVNAEVPELKNDGKYNLYVKCKDANGNTNDDLFVISFCVQAGADITPPVIESTSIANGMPVQYGLNQTPLEIYVNEPADCRYSIGIDKEYTQMENNMTCARHIYELNNMALYKCSGTLKGIQTGRDNDYYFKCRDQPLLGESNDRMTMQESYKFTLKGSSNNLVITSVKPNGTVQGSGNLAAVYLEVKTEFGSSNGNAICNYYCNKTIPSNFGEKYYTKFLETGTTRHIQRLDVDEGDWKCKVQCVDLGGNSASNETTFTIKLDNNPPEVERIYNEAGKIKVITDKKATCSYSNNDDRQCLFLIGDGTNMPYSNSTDHFADWDITKTYYIKCMDINGKQPDANQCSIIVKPRA